MSLKMDKALLLLSRSRANGGNPFLFAFLGAKPHYLARKIPNFHLKEFRTAATDGKVFFWNPEFIDRLEPADILTVMEHESMHVVLNHVERSVGKHPKVWNIAIDFVVNAHMEHDHRLMKRQGSPWKVPVFGPNITLERFLRFLEGKAGLPKNNGKGGGTFTDPSLYKTSVNEIYNEILKRWNETGDDVKKRLDEQFDGQESMDAHVACEADDDQVQEELIRASRAAEAMESGSTPGYVKDAIDHLVNPTFSFLDVIRFAIFNKSTQDGVRSNWKRPRRRYLSIDQFLPTRHDYKPKWLCLLDTSGSMTDEDIMFGVSQLQSLGDETDGIIVPCDAKVHWDAAMEVKNATDLKHTEVKGRGGTTFVDFFKNYKEKLGSEFDVIIVITDGLIPKTPSSLAPECDCIWAITRKKEFKPPFGRVASLRGK
jgi:predicted metal-dependent peptidase